MLVLPALYGFGLHAAATHFIPRYGAPFIPLFAMILAVAVHELYARRRNRQKNTVA